MGPVYVACINQLHKVPDVHHLQTAPYCGITLCKHRRRTQPCIVHSATRCRPLNLLIAFQNSARPAIPLALPQAYPEQNALRDDFTRCRGCGTRRCSSTWGSPRRTTPRAACRTSTGAPDVSSPPAPVRAQQGALFCPSLAFSADPVAVWAGSLPPVKAAPATRSQGLLACCAALLK
jgi:hypothetical protein